MDCIWVNLKNVGPPFFKFISVFTIHQIFSLARDWSKRVTWANIPELKLGISEDIPQFLKPMDNKLNTIASIGLRKYARIFDLGHYLFLEAHSFPRASLSENCSLLGTDDLRCPRTNIRAYFRANEGYCLYIKMSFKDGAYYCYCAYVLRISR